MKVAIGVVGWVAGAVTMLTSAPQLWRVMRTSDTRVVSLGTYAPWAVTALWWAAWAWQVRAWPSLVVNLVSLVLNLLIVARLKTRPWQWILTGAGLLAVGLAWSDRDLILVVAMLLQAWVALPTLRLVLRKAALDGVSAATWVGVLVSNVLWVLYLFGIGEPRATVVDLLAASSAVVILTKLQRARTA